MSNQEQPSDIKQAIISAYKSIVEGKKELPIRGDFLLCHVTNDQLRQQFGGIEALHVYMKVNHSEFLDLHFSTVATVFDRGRGVDTANTQTYIVTTAVADSEAHQGFLNAMESYCDLNEATIAVMPCESITNSFEKQTAVFDKVFNDPKYLFVQDDTELNENISLCSIQVSAKQIRPITGLSRVGRREGSYIFASPKQFLEYVPAGNKRGSNYTIMTPGACTLPKYFSETFVSKRLSYIAAQDHTLGAIIVEIQDEKIFHFRQIQCADDGSFIDLGVEYMPDGTTHKVAVNAVLGDTHGVQVDHEAYTAFCTLLTKLQTSRVYMHDIYDGNSISHHITEIAAKQRRVMKNRSSLEKELIESHDTVAYLDEMVKPDEIIIVKSNHDEFLDRYLAAGRYISDPDNHYLALKIAPALFEEGDVLKHAFEVVGCEIPDHWNFLSRGDSSMIAGIELGSHGDLGLNGAKSSLNGLEKIYGKCVIGHNHTAAIQRGVFRVGTLSELDMEYNRGPSSWTQTCCLVYDNGQRQLINYVGGRCSLQD